MRKILQALFTLVATTVYSQGTQLNTITNFSDYSCPSCTYTPSGLVVGFNDNNNSEQIQLSKYYYPVCNKSSIDSVAYEFKYITNAGSVSNFTIQTQIVMQYFNLKTFSSNGIDSAVVRSKFVGYPGYSTPFTFNILLNKGGASSGFTLKLKELKVISYCYTTTGLNENVNDDPFFSVYGNTLVCNEKLIGRNINVYDIYGSLVTTIKLENTDTLLNTNLANGLYFFEYEGNVKKAIIKE